MTPVPSTPTPKKPVWGRWWMITIYAVVGLCVLGTLGQALNGGGTSGDDATEGRDSAVDTSDSAADDLDPTESEHSFEAQTYTGDGDDVLDLPAGAADGIVNASHSGNGAFIVDVLDEHNESNGDLLITAFGSYTGTVAFGLWNDGGAKLQVQADGEWEITVAPLAEAPELALPAEGEGDAVYRYATGADTWHLTHDGDGAFIVQSTVDLMGLLVTEFGDYDSNVPVVDGTGIVTIRADGAWTIAQK